jgi:hypothetical protein
MVTEDVQLGAIGVLPSGLRAPIVALLVEELAHHRGFAHYQEQAMVLS